MKAIARNVLLAFIISTFALFGALGGSASHNKNKPEKQVTVWLFHMTESDKETFTCFGVAGLVWMLCFWRCTVINRRLRAEREFQSRFNEYARNSSLTRNFY
jgi:hypothetical protein